MYHIDLTEFSCSDSTRNVQTTYGYNHHSMEMLLRRDKPLMLFFISYSGFQSSDMLKCPFSRSFQIRNVKHSFGFLFMKFKSLVQTNFVQFFVYSENKNYPAHDTDQAKLQSKCGPLSIQTKRTILLVKYLCKSEHSFKKLIISMVHVARL